jgi:hypothetical protein
MSRNCSWAPAFHKYLECQVSTCTLRAGTELGVLYYLDAIKAKSDFHQTQKTKFT